MLSTDQSSLVKKAAQFKWNNIKWKTILINIAIYNNLIPTVKIWATHVFCLCTQ